MIPGVAYKVDVVVDAQRRFPYASYVLNLNVSVGLVVGGFRIPFTCRIKNVP